MNKQLLTGIILAGGKSSRMGTDKGMVQLNGKRFIDHILTALLPNVNELIIIANNGNYNHLGYKVYKDLIKDCGPIGGIYTGLMKSETQNNFIVSCDIPFINSDLVSHIIKNTGDADIAVPVNHGSIEPLCGIYKKSTAGEMYKLIRNNEFKMHNILTHFFTKEIYISKTDKFYTDKLLVNINSRDELNQQMKMKL